MKGIRKNLKSLNSACKGLLLVALLFLVSCNEKSNQEAQWLFVQNSESISLKDGVLTMTGVSPTTLFFSDRPERYGALGMTEEFVGFWNKGGDDSFKSDPPNADISLVKDGVADNIVVTLKNPKLNGDILTYDVEVVEGADEFEGGPAALFVDIVGRPLTPVSVAGVARRTTRRTVRRRMY